MKRLFTDNDEFTSEAHGLRQELYDALYPIMRYWADRGYSLRDISYLAMTEADHVGLSLILDKRFAPKKKEG